MIGLEHRYLSSLLARGKCWDKSYSC